MADHLVILPERDDAEELTDELVGVPGIHSATVVREALAGEEDSEDHEWAIHLDVDDDAAQLIDALHALTEAAGGDTATAEDTPLSAERRTPLDAALDALAAAYDGWHDADPHH